MYVHIYVYAVPFRFDITYMYQRTIKINSRDMYITRARSEPTPTVALSGMNDC